MGEMRRGARGRSHPVRSLQSSVLQNDTARFDACVDPGRNFRSNDLMSGRSGQDVAAAKVDAGGGEGTVRLLGGCGSCDGDARLEFALVGDL
jgi:hypothetical protein